MDRTVTLWINSFAGASPFLDWTMIAASKAGVPLLVLYVVLQWWSRNDRLSVRHTCVAAGLAFLIGLGINQIILLFIHRIRPYDAGLTHLIISRSADWSFPSDHATATFAIASTFLLRRACRRAWVLLSGTLLVCVSRVYVGTHYATDIIGGAMTGAIAAAIVLSAYWEGTWADKFVTGFL